jgi:hypothetical protein
VLNGEIFMKNQENIYLLTKTCLQGKHLNKFNLTKIEAAFEKYSFQKYSQVPCSQCGDTIPASMSCESPKIDQELLDLWGNDTSLYFSSQDEDVILAQVNYLSMLLKAVDEQQYLESKIGTLIAALCVMLYDNLIGDEEEKAKEKMQRQKNVEKVKPELLKRKKKIEKFRMYVMDYIQEIVFLELGMEVSK